MNLQEEMFKSPKRTSKQEVLLKECKSKVRVDQIVIFNDHAGKVDKVSEAQIHEKR